VSSRTSLTARISRDLGLTRPLLDRLPEAALTWRPHPRSFTLAGLGTHIARLPHWGAQLLAEDRHDLAAGGPSRPPLASRAGIVALFDRHVAEWHAALAAVDDARLDAPWTLLDDTRVVETLSHTDALDRYLLHHLIHHRGQLTVYLRLLDVPLPALYGPTADLRP